MKNKISKNCKNKYYYHYLNFYALTEIMISSKLRVKNIKCFNDSLEFNYVFTIIDKIVNEIKDDDLIKSVNDMKQYLKSNQDISFGFLEKGGVDFSNCNLYAFCLSSNKDDPTLFSNFSGRDGCCLKINESVLSDYLKIQFPQFKIKKVIYDEKVIKKDIIKIKNDTIDVDDYFVKKDYKISNFESYVEFIRSIVKYKGFEYENETRVLIKSKTDSDYIFVNIDFNLLVEEIICSPSFDEDKRRALRKIVNYFYPKIKVNNSEFTELYMSK